MSDAGNSAMVSEPTMSRVEQTNALETSVSRLHSSGKQRLRGLSKLGISTIRDLLCAYPARYNDFSQIVPIARAPLHERSSVLGHIVDVKVKHPRPRLMVIEVSLNDGTATLIASWFNQPWLQKLMVKGARVIFQGKVEHTYGFRRMNAPLHTLLADDSASGGIIPVYHANADVSQGWVFRMVGEALSLTPALLDPLPVKLRVERNLMSRHAALCLIHRPTDAKRLYHARRRLAFEEVFFLQLFLLRRRMRANALNPARTHRIDGPALCELTAALPFTLTTDQKKAIGEILDDMSRPEPMNRLLLGDVGSGKTIVAASALAAVCDSGFQAAMMAPTEVLAEQYASKLGPLFDAAGIRWALLASSTKASVRKQTLAALASGSLNVLFGTHALLEPDVIFCELSLIVIDEQHRFGVEQRETLRAKGKGSDFLSMTATPIPRSLALTIYGDMETSVIRTKPRETVRTTTAVISKKDIRFAYEAIREALKRGEQAYIVCPLIGEPDALTPAQATGDEAVVDARPGAGGTASKAADEDAAGLGGAAADEGEGGGEGDEEGLITEFSEEQDEGHIQAAEQEVRFLKAKVFRERTIGLMTSRLKSTEKRQVMDDFRAGRIDILVSTTVVEVGVDVPNATVMVIEDADRFGLSQLHQLRGRVGRGERDGEVFLVTATHNEDARKRLALMERSSDGFELAEFDLKLR
ncbi:MAG: ATP-dependent DNA helicase RecG, partial [Coriobacteriales bacterium]|nr:ATP-dependent DNA helicase RecG [Coriobacteriales bacterium]